MSAQEEKEVPQAQPLCTTEAKVDLLDPCDEILLTPTFDVQVTRALKVEQDKAYLESLTEDKTIETEKRKQELLLEMHEAEKQEKNWAGPNSTGT